MEGDAANPNKKVAGYSTFKDLEEAEYFVAETISRNKDAIQKWLKTADSAEEFESSFVKTTGKFLKKGEQSITDAKGEESCFYLQR